MYPQPQDAPADRYVVLEYLSEGGMGAIYIGKKLGAGGFEKEVVLKQLLPEFTQQEEFIDLFLREAKLSATLDHANIVHTIDLVTAGQDYFIVMEYLPGGDLRSLLKRAKRRGKRLSPSAALFITREILAALAYAHAKRDFSGAPLKLIHRDVSPSNLLVSFSGEVKLTDFGIAKAATHTSMFYRVKGKVGYMSPEQAKSEALDHRSDLYSIAVCMYEMLANERLFVNSSMMTSAEEMYEQPIPMLSQQLPEIPPDVDYILQKALSIDPNGRYQTAGQFAEALARCSHRHGLLMSSSELADELVAVCGPTESWREDEDDEDSADRPGTAIIDESEDDPFFAVKPKGPTLPASRSGLGDAAAMRPQGGKKMSGRELTSILTGSELDEKKREFATGENVAVSRAAPLPHPRADQGGPKKPNGSSAATANPGGVGHGPASGPSPGSPASGPSPAQPAGTKRPSNSQATASRPASVAPARKWSERANARSGAQSRLPRWFRWWMVVLAIVLLAGVAAAIIGLSGPEMG